MIVVAAPSLRDSASGFWYSDRGLPFFLSR
jgi:hypothetical protein